MAYKSISWNDVAEGDELPIQAREITRTTIVASAIATRDFTPVHHDHEVAQNEGAKDIFLNILSTGGFVGKYLTDWSGPEGKIKNITIKLGATVYPGDTLMAGGKISKKYADGGDHLVDIDYSFSVTMGPHAWGNATMILPAKG